MVVGMVVERLFLELLIGSKENEFEVVKDF